MATYFKMQTTIERTVCDISLRTGVALNSLLKINAILPIES